MKIRCILVDDEQPARDELRYLLSLHSDIDIAGEAASAESAIALIRKNSPDLVFLDIQMGSRNGFEVVAALGDTKPPPFFVFVTAYDQYAVKAFEESAVDYLLKPLAEGRLASCLSRIRNLLKAQSSPDLHDTLHHLLSNMTGTPAGILKVSVEKQGRMLLLAPEEIIFCQLEENRIQVHTRHETLPLYGITTMDRLEEHLQRAPFFRCHRSVLVNLDHIREFSPWFNGKYNLVMADDENSELTVSRSRVKTFKQRLGI